MHQPCNETNADRQQAIIIKDCMSEGSKYTLGIIAIHATIMGRLGPIQKL